MLPNRFKQKVVLAIKNTGYEQMTQPTQLSLGSNRKDLWLESHPGFARRGNANPQSKRDRNDRFSLRRQTLPRLAPFLKSSLELCDRARQGFGLLIRGEVTAGQPLDLEAELTETFFREVDLPVLERIFIAAAHQER